MPQTLIRTPETDDFAPRRAGLNHRSPRTKHWIVRLGLAPHAGATTSAIAPHRSPAGPFAVRAPPPAKPRDQHHIDTPEASRGESARELLPFAGSDSPSRRQVVRRQQPPPGTSRHGQAAWRYLHERNRQCPSAPPQPSPQAPPAAQAGTSHRDSRNTAWCKQDRACRDRIGRVRQDVSR